MNYMQTPTLRDALQITSPTTVTVTGVGSAYSAVLTLAKPIDLSRYSLITLSNPPGVSTTFPSTGQSQLQGLVNGVWVTLATYTNAWTGANTNFPVITTTTSFPSTGILTALRNYVQVTAGTGSFGAQWNVSLYLQYGTQQSVETAA
jgi:hypothetical protein